MQAAAWSMLMCCHARHSLVQVDGAQQHELQHDL